MDELATKVVEFPERFIVIAMMVWVCCDQRNNDIANKKPDLDLM